MNITENEKTMLKLHNYLDKVNKYLAPLLPLANCHMVEFFTDDHWEKFLPKSLKKYLDTFSVEQFTDIYWRITSTSTSYDTSECMLENFIGSAKANFIYSDNEICLSLKQFQEKISKLGGELTHLTQFNEFMSSKKCYEVKTMSQYAATLHNSLKTTHCVDIGGGRGNLPSVLSLAYNIPSLTVDCDDVSIRSGEKREKNFQKHWRAQNADFKNLNIMSNCNKAIPLSDLHKFVNAYVTRHTNLEAVVKDNFKQHNDEVKLLLTGLHTCGNLGPDSLRIFNSQQSVNAVFNVPCCYHLLSEAIDGNILWDAFERNYVTGEHHLEGFPMSYYLKGVNLGRNARMVAAQSIDRVVDMRQLPSDSLFYRALLQVIIKKYVPSYNIAEGKLKRIYSKCTNVYDYIAAADKLLNLGLSNKISHEGLTKLVEFYERQKCKMVMFYLIRLCLAQVIEGVILLDRVLYLRENGFDNVFLVKLFDPVLSPRCHAIVALR